MTTTDTEYLIVQPDGDTRLAQLHAQYADAKAAADAASATLKAITDAIKLELTQAAPEETKVALVSDNGPRMTLTYSETWRFDSTRFKREDPETYVRFAKKSGSWTLKAVAGGE